MDHIGRFRDEEDIPENVVSPIPDPEQETMINQKSQKLQSLCKKGWLIYFFCLYGGYPRITL
jgi:hypothetical protein